MTPEFLVSLAGLIGGWIFLLDKAYHAFLDKCQGNGKKENGGEKK